MHVQVDFICQENSQLIYKNILNILDLLFYPKTEYKLLVIAIVKILFIWPNTFWTKEHESTIWNIYVIKAKYTLLVIAKLIIISYICSVNYFITWFFCFWDTAIHAIKAKYEINKIYPIKTKKVIGYCWFIITFIGSITLFYNMFLSFEIPLFISDEHAANVKLLVMQKMPS